MSFFNRLGAAKRGNPLENPATPLSAPAAWLFDLFGGSPTSAGVTVNETTAMQLATVYSCVNVLASDVSSLPLKVYEQVEKGKRPAIDSDLYYLLAVEPNPEMTAPAFWGCFLGCAALTGNGYAEIQRGSSNKPMALWPRHPHKVKAKRASGSEKLVSGKNATPGDLIYEVTDTGTERYIPAADMLHLPALTLDGWTGLSPIMAAKQTVGTAIAAEKFGAGFFGRGSRPSGLLAPAENMKAGDVRLTQARESWEKVNSGDNQGRTAVMPMGWTWTKIGISPGEAQFLETQQYTRTQIAAIFRIPPHMVGDTSRLSNSNHESQALEYVTFTLRPWLVRIEAEVQRKLMPTVGRSAGKYTVRFDVAELIRGDFASQMNGFAVGKQWSFLNTNDIRESLGLNPIGPEGDVYYVPLNMVPIGPNGDPLDDPANGDDTDVTPGGEDDNGAPDDGTGGNGGSKKKAKGNGGQNQRMLLDRMQRAFGGIFRDAVGRLATRQKRDGEAVAQICGPVLEAIAAEAIRQAVTTFRLKPDAEFGQEKILRDYRSSLAKRAAEWKAELDETEASAELARAIRAITIGIFREAGSVLAQAE
jgi:HK97 family phage portal protein